ncbi:hypothetical protein FOWG_16910 [Fusarium oxysporum f. sp. lycopersici MN25]|uniref:Uncharacterized protein n=1 Tax=Fusarium oxysporum (strain Fo5176) TaxID=660025 RepID=A0A0C4DIM6_FUSOF|nr:hypothetical protein FOWG_16910 [Fusarium oxysporum f. sp. lycopersici MN25]
MNIEDIWAEVFRKDSRVQRYRDVPCRISTAKLNPRVVPGQRPRLIIVESLKSLGPGKDTASRELGGWRNEVRPVLVFSGYSVCSPKASRNSALRRARLSIGEVNLESTLTLSLHDFAPDLECEGVPNIPISSSFADICGFLVDAEEVQKARESKDGRGVKSTRKS